MSVNVDLNYTEGLCDLQTSTYPACVFQLIDQRVLVNAKANRPFDYVIWQLVNMYRILWIINDS
jgi:hypothetical protein